MRFASFSASALLLASGLAMGSCTLFRPREKAPVVETVRTVDSPTPPTAARDLADVIAADLQLTTEQTGQVRSILNGTVQQANAAKAKYPAKSPQLMAELKRVNAESQNELKTLLGPVKFKQLQTDQRKIAAEMQQKQK